MSRTTNERDPRRAFLARCVAGAGALVAGPALVSASAGERAIAAAEVHPLDKWIADLTGEYRLVLDAVTPKGATEVVQYGSTYLSVNSGAYGLPQAKTSVIGIVRNMAAAFGFNDEAWAMFTLGEHAEFDDPRTKARAVRNTASGGFAGMVRQGATIAVCGMATQYYAGLIARKQGKSAADIYKELEARLIPGARIVPSGISTVDRCQRERFSYAYVG